VLFKIDENLPDEIAGLLLAGSHDAKTVGGQNLKGVNDKKLMALCKEEGRALVTLDTDFANIRAYPPEKYNGIIVLRVVSQGKKHVIDIFAKVFIAIGREPLNQRLWIVEENAIRIRGKED